MKWGQIARVADGSLQAACSGMLRALIRIRVEPLCPIAPRIWAHAPLMVPIGSAKGFDAVPMPSGPTWTGRGGSGRVNVMCGKADPRAPERVARARPLRRRHRFGSHRRCGVRRAPRFDARRPPTCLVVARRNNLASSLQTSSSADQRRESHRRINQPTETMYRASSSSPEPGRRARCDAERCIGIISPAWHLAVYG